MPVAINAIQREIPISNTQFSQLQAAFLTACAIMYVGGGRLIDDAWACRSGFALIMAMVVAGVCKPQPRYHRFQQLAASRFLLGMGEGGGFPAATKAIAEWFPTRERSTAMGIVNAGTAVGAVAAPPLIALILATLNWRWVFALSGASPVLLWTLWWPGLLSYPRQSRADAREPVAPWLPLLRDTRVQGLVFAKFLSDSAWYFYLFWLPKYLYDARGFDTKHVGYYAWIPYAASGVGSLAGGWFSSRLIESGHSLNFARKLALGAGAALMPWIFFVTHAPVHFAIVLLSIAFFGQQSWSTLVMILPADLFPRGAIGSVAGLVGFGGAMGGVIFGLVVGYLLDNGYGYGAVFALVSTFHVAAFCVILATVRRSAFDPRPIS